LICFVMARRGAKNSTGIARLENLQAHDAWAGFVCVRCGLLNTVRIGQKLLAPDDALESCRWSCGKCGFEHGKDSALPDWDNWPGEATAAGSAPAMRFWQGFFRIHTENPSSYWKQCNTCGRVLPFQAFSRHAGWGPLERQMECRSCKGAINAVLNPLRTKEQMQESASRRRVSELLLKGENERMDFADLFKRFGGKCFKTGQKLDIHARETWELDHILPSTWLYPMTKANACLLSKEANQNKKAAWPSHFYTNNELIELARITGADLSLLASREPVVNPEIDVDACVTRYLKVREGGNLQKRVKELRDLLDSRGLSAGLSAANKRLLGHA